MTTRLRLVAFAAALAGVGSPAPSAQEQIVRVPLAYRAPGNGPAPNFSPKGTQVPLSALDSKTTLPADAVLNSRVLARTGAIKVGPTERSWVRVIATADPAHPADLTRLYIDRNRNDGSKMTVHRPPPCRPRTKRRKRGGHRTKRSSCPCPSPTARSRSHIS